MKSLPHAVTVSISDRNDSDITRENNQLVDDAIAMHVLLAQSG